MISRPSPSSCLISYITCLEGGTGEPGGSIRARCGGIAENWHSTIEITASRLELHLEWGTCAIDVMKC